MKRIGIGFGVVLMAICSLRFSAQATNPFEEFVGKDPTAFDPSFADPFAKAFATGITGGIYRTAATHGFLGFDVGFRSMFVFPPWGAGTALDVANIKFLPVPVLQATAGLPMDAEVMLRGIAGGYKGANISLIGVGLKKNFKSLIPIPMFPDVAAMISYHRFSGKYETFDLKVATGGTPDSVTATFDTGDLMKSSHWSFDLIASKKLSLAVVSIQPYVGLGLDRSSVDFEWTMTETDPSTAEFGVLPYTVSGTSSVTTTRMTLGLDISPFPFIHVFGDYNIGKFPQVTAGVALSFR